MILHYKDRSSGPAIVFLHGLLGSGDNWNTIAGSFLDRHRVIQLDLRNHGRSFHKAEMNYELMADDVIAVLDDCGIDKAIVLGHSMGGKVAMQLALAHPHRVDKLIIVDSTPLEFDGGHEWIMHAIQSTDLSFFASRKEIEEAMSKKLVNDGLRYFIMKNIARSEDSYHWKLNIDAIIANYDMIKAPIHLAERPYTSPVLVIRGENSDYIEAHDLEAIRDRFPNSEVVTIENAGHWVHAEQPDELKRHLMTFIPS